MGMVNFSNEYGEDVGRREGEEGVGEWLGGRVFDRSCCWVLLVCNFVLRFLFLL